MNGTPPRSRIEILVDADACPVKDEIYRVAERAGVRVVVVANRHILVPKADYIERMTAAPTPDAADDLIAARAGADSVVVTSDIPLASRCVKAGARVVAPNGDVLTEANVGLALATRDLMSDLRAQGETTRGPRAFSPRDRSRFLSALDQAVRRLARRASP
ncbi:YaiI/YqxD family protein [Methylocella sp.]|uniref:YaiI/YqxD family protein n=1 Tax=Methylocella sp. TaxID=1978226 RepID=UPI0037848E00